MPRPIRQRGFGFVISGQNLSERILEGSSVAFNPLNVDICHNFGAADHYSLGICVSMDCYYLMQFNRAEQLHKFTFFSFGYPDYNVKILNTVVFDFGKNSDELYHDFIVINDELVVLRKHDHNIDPFNIQYNQAYVFGPEGYLFGVGIRHRLLGICGRFVFVVERSNILVLEMINGWNQSDVETLYQIEAKSRTFYSSISRMFATYDDLNDTWLIAFIGDDPSAKPKWESLTDYIPGGYIPEFSYRFDFLLRSSEGVIVIFNKESKVDLVLNMNNEISTFVVHVPHNHIMFGNSRSVLDFWNDIRMMSISGSNLVLKKGFIPISSIQIDLSQPESCFVQYIGSMAIFQTENLIFVDFSSHIIHYVPLNGRSWQRLNDGYLCLFSECAVCILHCGRNLTLTACISHPEEYGVPVGIAHGVLIFLETVVNSLLIFEQAVPDSRMYCSLVFC
ncbi:hypothetical protein PCE1_003214 [Barthelona sp. PCE]